MTCDGCKWLGTTLRKFAKRVVWCRLYKCKPDGRCVDFKDRHEAIAKKEQLDADQTV